MVKANQIALTIIVSIILTTILVSLVNVGISVFIDEPKYEDFCDYRTQEIVETEQRCIDLNGTWNPEGRTYPRILEKPEIEGYCDLYVKCNKEYENERNNFNQIRFYILAGIGFILLLVGLFTTIGLVQLTGLATGGILVFEGIVTNFENKIVTFISLLLILIIFGILAYRIIQKYEKKQ